MSIWIDKKHNSLSHFVKRSKLKSASKTIDLNLTMQNVKSSSSYSENSSEGSVGDLEAAITIGFSFTISTV